MEEVYESEEAGAYREGERTIRPEHPPSILDPGPPLPFPPPPCPARLTLASSGLLSIDLTRLSGSRIGCWPVHLSSAADSFVLRLLLLPQPGQTALQSSWRPLHPPATIKGVTQASFVVPSPQSPIRPSTLLGGSFANTLACVCHM